MFGCETYGIRPDIMVMSKALSSSYLPISALVANDRVLDPIVEETDRIGTFGHGFTAGGHPVAAAVALESIRVIEEDGLVERAARSGARLLAGLRAMSGHRLVGEVRGVGLIAAVELVADKEAKTGLGQPGQLGGLVAGHLQQLGVITRNMGDSIAFCPPLVISENEVDELLGAFGKALDRTEADLSAA
jgi:4-aminobutyrate--pyruvate transaminase